MLPLVIPPASVCRGSVADLSRRAVEGYAVSLYSKPTFLRRLGCNERRLSAPSYGGWSRHSFEAVDVEVFVEIKTEKFGCAAEDEGAGQEVAQALEYFVAHDTAE
jgi:hypothetical protein